MQNYNQNPSFALLRVEKIRTPLAELVELEHKKTGARIIFLDREDDNKTFAIGFRTPPEDSTGVFHIIEHCVLAGSRKYPVKDPMTELMKGSLYTYLNALTYPDKTIYPISSKNNKAFLDLIDVYLDSVFHPLALTNKSIFLSEGHRIDFDEHGSPTLNGVVYNEMLGAYSSPDELTEHYVSSLIYKGGSYQHDSGGWPTDIPTLTYESFKEAHHRYYHPTNSFIFLDGSVDLSATLSLIDSYLSEYEKRDAIEKPEAGVLDPEPLTEYYPIDGDETQNKTRVTLAFPGFDHSDAQGTLAMNVIIDSIADSNSSPLKKSILDSELCENVHFYYSGSNKRGALFVQLINVKDGCIDELISLTKDSFKKIIETGINRTSLESVINLTELKTREADFGSFPSGMVYMNAALEFAALGEDPIHAFEGDILFDDLRKKLDTGYYESLLKRITEGKHATLILKPKKDFSIKPEIGEFNPCTAREELEQMYKWIDAPDTEEALATIPTLTLSDLNESRSPIPTEEIKSDGATVLLRRESTSGIVYADMFFDVSDIDDRDLATLRLITLIIGDAATKNGDAKHFKDRVKMHLGDLSLGITPISKDGKARIYLSVRGSSLSTKVDELAALTEELIYTATLDDKAVIKKKLEQIHTASEEALKSDTLSACLSRVSARYDPLSAVKERISGYDFHTYLKRALKDPDCATADISRVGRVMREKYLKKGRLILSVTAEDGDAAKDKLLAVIKAGEEVPKARTRALFEKRNEAIAIPGTVGYSAYGSNLITELSEKYRGAYGVLTSILGYEYLWSEIRVKGGAYDTGMLVRGASGGVLSYSYRDPSPMKSIDVFSSISEAAKNAVNDADLEKYIISTTGSMDPVSTPRSRASSENLLYLSGKSQNYPELIRREVVGTDKNELMELLSVIARLKDTSTYCIAANRSLIDDEEFILEI